MAETLVETISATIPETSSNLETGETKAANDPGLREQVKRLYFQGIRPEVICSETGVKRGTLRTWINRYGWLRTVHASRAIVEKRQVMMLTRETSGQLEQASGKLREQFAGILAKGADALSQATVKPSAGSVRDFAEALEPLVRSAKVVHSWGNDGPSGLILADVLSTDRELPAIDVAQVACGPDTTTGSVPAIEGSVSTPQEEQPTIPQTDPAEPH